MRQGQDKGAERKEAERAPQIGALTGQAPYWRIDDFLVRPFAKGDEQSVLLLRNESPEVFERAYDKIEHVVSREQAEDWIIFRIKDSENSDRRALLVERASDGEALGMVDIWEADSHSGVFRTGVKMTVRSQGKGVASKAFARVLDYYFFELRYQKCGVYIYEFNERSIRFHESFGFSMEGRLKRERYTKGRYFDALWYGLTREERATRAGAEAKF